MQHGRNDARQNRKGFDSLSHRKTCFDPVSLGRKQVCSVVPPKFSARRGRPLFSLRGRSPALSAPALYAGSADVLPLLPLSEAHSHRLPSLSSGAQVLLLHLRHIPAYLFRVRFGLIISRQSRSPRCKPRIRISAVARFVAIGILCVSQRWIVCISC